MYLQRKKKQMLTVCSSHALARALPGIVGRSLGVFQATALEKGHVKRLLQGGFAIVAEFIEAFHGRRFSCVVHSGPLERARYRRRSRGQGRGRAGSHGGAGRCGASKVASGSAGGRREIRWKAEPNEVGCRCAGSIRSASGGHRCAGAGRRGHEGLADSAWTRGRGRRGSNGQTAGDGRRDGRGSLHRSGDRFFRRFE
ncbi:hypothetical protein C8R47DRAFT_506668 [Mycena vitilis]|nr:hypothetical protein C8R47DRAFT_506668 [Mycena vitilis]